MHSLSAFAAPFALMLPVMSAVTGVPAVDDPSRGSASLADGGEVTAQAPPRGELLDPLTAMRQTAVARQVRIEQRVVVRITPHPAAARQNLLAELPKQENAVRFEERGKEKCVPLGEIAGVRTGSGNRLVLFLRDRKMLSANLEKACRARDFYSGFYVEKNKDGRLCVSRDKIQSRTGASCEVEVMRQLIEVHD